MQGDAVVRHSARASFKCPEPVGDRRGGCARHQVNCAHFHGLASDGSQPGAGHSVIDGYGARQSSWWRGQSASMRLHAVHSDSTGQARMPPCGSYFSFTVVLSGSLLGSLARLCLDDPIIPRFRWTIAMPAFGMPRLRWHYNARTCARGAASVGRRRRLRAGPSELLRWG